MAKTRSMIRNRSHDDDDAVRIPWSDLNRDVLFLVMMKLGVIDFVSFSGVCKSWRSFALSNRKRFMASRPPMLMRFSHDAYKKKCYFEDFEGRSFKTILPHSSDGRTYVGLTCGYLVFYMVNSHDFWLINPITRHQLHFPYFPCLENVKEFKAILVFSPAIPGWVFVVINRFGHEILFSIAGTGAWNHVYSEDYFLDLHAFKGKIYTLNFGGRLYEMSLNPNPKLTLLEIKNSGKRYFYVQDFISSGENLYVIDTLRESYDFFELDFGEMKWVWLDENTIGECAFFLSGWKHCIAIKPDSWAVDPRLKYKSYDLFRGTTDDTKKGRFFYADMWYFPHHCLDVDTIDE